MDNQINLTFGTPVEQKPTEIADNTKNNSELNSLSLDMLSPEDKQKVLTFSETIDISDSTAIISYGVDSQNKIAGFSDTVLKNVRTKDTGAAGKLLSNLVSEIKNFDSNVDEKPGFFGLFSGIKKSFDKVSANYKKVEANIDVITDNMESHKRTLLKDISILDEMYDNNYIYYKELTMYIIAGKEKLDRVHNIDIPALREKIEASNDEVDIQRLSDLQNFANRFEKKLHDLMLSRMISIQMAPQIRLIQNNDHMLVEKIQSSIVNSIPLWKNQIVIALGLANSKAALETQKKISDMTNELLKKNSELLKQGSLEIAAEGEKSIISLDTIRKTNQDLIDTINGVLDIQKKGHEDRMAAEGELMRMENDFKTALLEAKKKN